MGLSRREFAKAEGCSEGAVRYALRQRRLVAKPDGTLDPSQLGGGWLRNYRPKSKSRAKSAQVAEVAQQSAQIPADVARSYGWDDPEFSEETTDAIGVFLTIGDEYRKDLETIGVVAAHYGSGLLQREAYKVGWRGLGDPPPDQGLSKVDDADPIGPKEIYDDLNAQILNFGLVRRLGRAMAPDDPNDKDAVPLDISDPIAVADRMIHLAVHFCMEDLKRRRRALGIVSPRDKRFLKEASGG
ncbi:hypothetical protein [Bradyrhizobium elkanii]|uniref:hypothetical protein n=1 Tax=Bradyrhizobium elkanii TaxID=29448 RepID=UPI00209DB483|nr:hypothetical protein [Bradyrhizobium elkanii]MCP1969776.1 hypothetical protein [Bradyrhizobium elkanii]MCS4108716.1 hypothetical protein [Bradyrhizobium elkanii]